jgi:mRNA interferase RelE/StbE
LSSARLQERNLSGSTAGGTPIIAFLRQRIAAADDPRSFGQALKGERFGEFWKDRMGDYRIIARMQDERLAILVLRVGHRSSVYNNR